MKTPHFQFPHIVDFMLTSHVQVFFIYFVWKENSNKWVSGWRDVVSEPQPAVLHLVQTHCLYFDQLFAGFHTRQINHTSHQLGHRQRSTEVGHADVAKIRPASPGHGYFRRRLIKNCPLAFVSAGVFSQKSVGLRCNEDAFNYSVFKHSFTEVASSQKIIQTFHVLLNIYLNLSTCLSWWIKLKCQIRKSQVNFLTCQKLQSVILHIVSLSCGNIRCHVWQQSVSNGG